MRRGLLSYANTGNPGQVIRRDRRHDLATSLCRSIPLRKSAEPKRQIKRSPNGQTNPDETAINQYRLRALTHEVAIFFTAILPSRCCDLP